MLSPSRSLFSSALTGVICLGGVLLSLLLGWVSGWQPMILAPLLVSGAALLCFFLKFEQTVMVLLVIRSAIDIFSAQQIPAAFAIGLDLLTLLYIGVAVLTGQRIFTSRFLWLFAGWIGVQTLWVILLPLGGLGMGSGHLTASLREWVRLFSLLMVYFLILQLQTRLAPKQVVTALFYSLPMPLTAATLQILLPASALPAFLSHRGNAFTELENASRINGTLGHPNALATFLVLFVGLTYWQATTRRTRWPWICLLGVLVFFIVSTKALVGLVMIAVLCFALVSRQLTIPKLLGSVLIVALIVFAFGSTEFGRERLALFTSLPFFNSDIDVSRAILLRQQTTNSFYWRLEQWTFLLRAWAQHPWLGYGFDAPRYLTHFNNSAHNDYIRALVESGIVGLVTFVSFLMALGVRLWRISVSQLSTPGQKSLAWTLLSVLLAMMAGMLTENVWSHTVLFFYWFALVAVAGFDWRSSAKPEIDPASLYRRDVTSEV